ncbi:hypothetical protein M3Y94_00382800 [Aphelenchoides besseyi]|nr:hypothetical protein M3Y94_00382800 [Aphelenchoides besseyi]
MCSWNRTNETELLAINCIQQQQGSFFDACSNQCMSDVYFLYLRQDLGIEHFVYGHLFPVLVALVVLTNGLVVVIYSKKEYAFIYEYHFEIYGLGRSLCWISSIAVDDILFFTQKLRA